MSVRLSIYNVPPNLPLEQFKSPFEELNGFKQAHYIYNTLNQPIGGIVEFSSLETADYAKKILQNYKYLNSASGIMIDFTREEPPLNNSQIYQQQQMAHQQLVQAQQAALRPQIMQPVQPGQPSLQPPANVQNGGLLLNNNPYLRTQVSMIPQQSPSPMNFPLQAPPQRTASQSMPMDPGALMGIYPGLLTPGFPSQQLKESSKKIFEIPPDATNCLYVDGVPIDATEREVAHVFRPFPGYICARLIKKEAKNGRKFFYCFVDFENSMQSSIAMQTLQGYRFESKDRKGLKIAYATPTSLIRKRKRNSKSPMNR